MAGHVKSTSDFGTSSRMIYGKVFQACRTIAAPSVCLGDTRSWAQELNTLLPSLKDHCLETCSLHLSGTGDVHLGLVPDPLAKQ